MNGRGRPPQTGPHRLPEQPQHSARQSELGREALRWYLDGLGRHVPARYLPAARQALADLGEELEIAARLARRVA